MTEPLSKPILCFGEVLWDCLPQGLFPGGAPINVAYHLRRHGRRAVPVTAVGEDFLGEELLRRMQQWNLGTDAVTLVPDKMTGAVQVELDSGGSAKYKIIEDVAWDWIQVSAQTEQLAVESAAIVYGTLAQRAEHNRKQLAQLLARSALALKVYDVNLRPPFDDPSLVQELIRSANLIKLNDEELSRLLKRTLSVADLETGARDFAAQSGCARICVTAGSKGAGILLEGRWYWSEPQPIKVADTIGAGDSFLAALVNGLLDPSSNPQQTIDRASRLAEFVASQSGATPKYSVENGVVR